MSAAAKSADWSDRPRSQSAETAAEQTTDRLSVVGRHYVFKQFRLEVVRGPDKGLILVPETMEVSIGTDRTSDLVLSDPTVSSHHLILTVTARGVEVRDQGSTNGTTVSGCRVVTAYLEPGARLGLGETEIAFHPLSSELREELSEEDHFGPLLGTSAPMRRLFAKLAKFAPSSGTVLIQGETGTGKELVAEAIHRASDRADGPFVVVDCGAIPVNLIESELFGHVRGAFTGANDDRVGAFEAAAGGTIFLDEVGELPLESQPALLRALESRTVRPVGSSRTVDLDVRVVAATNRNLRAELNRGSFRPDLFYRLGVLEVTIPPLRKRRDDIPMLAAHFFRQLSKDGDTMPAPQLIAEFARRDWRGNVRELRAAVERALLVDDTAGDSASDEPDEFDINLPFRTAKNIATQRWAQRFLRDLVRAHRGNLTHAARAARMDRNYLRELLRKYDVDTAG